MLKVICACASGIGTSQMIKIKIQRVFDKLGVPVSITHCSIGDAKATGQKYDVIFCSANFADRCDKAAEAGTVIIGLKNLMDEKAIEAEIRARILHQE